MGGAGQIEPPIRVVAAVLYAENGSIQPQYEFIGRFMDNQRIAFHMAVHCGFGTVGFYPENGRQIFCIVIKQKGEAAGVVNLGRRQRFFAAPPIIAVVVASGRIARFAGT